MTASADPEVVAVAQAASRSGARPFKDATGNWAASVEVALMDTVLSIGAQVDGAYGAGVLPRLRAFKAFRGPANMMRVVATLGPFGLADFVPETSQIDQLMAAAGQLLDAGVQQAADVDPHSTEQQQALIKTEGVPDVAWPYFLLALDIRTPELAEVHQSWLARFVQAATGNPHLTPQHREALLQEAAKQLDAEHPEKSHTRIQCPHLPCRSVLGRYCVLNTLAVRPRDSCLLQRF